MLLRIPNLLTSEEVQEIRNCIEPATWCSGSITAGTQANQVKNNLQLPEDSPESIAARRLIHNALGRNALFYSATLPKKIFPPLFNRYDGEGNAFGNHVDTAIRTSTTTKAWVRTDLSMTIFLSEPESYDGGELAIDDLASGLQRIKLPVGEAILYPAGSVHRVEPVTRGCRLASFLWIESMVRSQEQRKLLFDMDMSILTLRETEGESPAIVQLTGCYHNLLRLWADT
jgi:PKHD-type hydroxylase